MGGLFVGVDLAVALTKPRVAGALLGLLLAGLRRSAYELETYARKHIAARAGLSIGELTYGETFFVVALTILRRVGVGRGSRVLDLGCGRGRLLLASRFLGAEAIGVDLISERVAEARASAGKLGAEINEGDARSAPLDGVTHVFCCWTTWSVHTRNQIADHLAALPSGTVIVTLTWPIDGDERFVLNRTRRLPFTWGLAEVHEHHRA